MRTTANRQESMLRKQAVNRAIPNGARVAAALRHSRVVAVDEGVTVRSHQTPKHVLEEMVAKTVAALFDAHVAMRVVMQRRSVSVSKLEHIDYAIPCFELAKRLELRPNDVASRIAGSLNASKDMSGFRVEAIAGYVNFQVPDEMVWEAVRHTSEWLTSSRKPAPAHAADTFIVVDSMMGSGQNRDHTAKVVGYLDEIYKLLGKKCSIVSLLGDASEDAVQAYAGGSDKKPRGEGSVLQFRREIVASQRPHSGHSLSPELSRLMEERRASMRAASPADVSSNTVVESEIAAMVHEFLDGVTETNIGVVRDPGSFAVYFEGSTTPVALRSAQGFLYSPAYALYILATLANDYDMSRVVVLAPAQLEHALNELFTAVRRDSGVRLTFFDPHTSLADVLEITRQTSSLDEHFLALADTLNAVGPAQLRSVAGRQTVFEAIDTPSLLAEVVDHKLMPALFDCINQSIRAQLFLGRQ